MWQDNWPVDPRNVVLNEHWQAYRGYSAGQCLPLTGSSLMKTSFLPRPRSTPRGPIYTLGARGQGRSINLDRGFRTLVTSD